MHGHFFVAEIWLIRDPCDILKHVFSCINACRLPEGDAKNEEKFYVVTPSEGPGRSYLIGTTALINEIFVKICQQHGTITCHHFTFEIWLDVFSHSIIIIVIRAIIA